MDKPFEYINPKQPADGKDIIQRYVEAELRNREMQALNNLSQAVLASRGMVPPPVEVEKTYLEQAQDAAVSALQGVVGVPQSLVGLADLGLLGGRALLSPFTGDTLENAGHIGKFLDNQGVRFADTQNIVNDWHTDKYKKQMEDFQKLNDLSMEQSFGDNMNSVGNMLGYLGENPALAANAAIQSLPQMYLGGLYARGLTKIAPRVFGKVAGAEAAGAGTGAASTGAQLLADAAKRYAPNVAAGGAGEGLSMAGSQQEELRAGSSTGYTTPGQSRLAVSTGLAGGLIGGLNAKLGINDIDMMAAGVRNTANGGLIRGTARLAAEATKEAGVEELPQTGIESMNRNMAQDRPLLDNVGHDATLAMAAAVSTVGGMHTPEVVKNTLSGVASATGNLKPASIQTLSDPTSNKYDPSAAYLRLQEHVNSSDARKAERAQQDIAKLHTDIQTEIDARTQEVDAAATDLEDANAAEQILANLGISVDDPNPGAVGGNTEEEIRDFQEQVKKKAELKKAHQEAVAALEKAKKVQTNLQITIDGHAQTVAAAENPISQQTADANIQEVIQPSSPEAGQAAADHVRDNLANYTDAHLMALADNPDNPYFTDAEKEALRKLSKLRIAENNLKDPDTVSNNVIYGDKNQKYLGLNDYRTHILNAISTGDSDKLDRYMGLLGNFHDVMQDKLKTVKDAKKLANSTGKQVQVVRTKAGRWAIYSGAKKIGDKELDEIGGLNINKDTPGKPDTLISDIEKDVSNIFEAHQALERVANTVTPRQQRTENLAPTEPNLSGSEGVGDPRTEGMSETEIGQAGLDNQDFGLDNTDSIPVNQTDPVSISEAQDQGVDVPNAPFASGLDGLDLGFDNSSESQKPASASTTPPVSNPSTSGLDSQGVTSDAPSNVQPASVSSPEPSGLVDNPVPVNTTNQQPEAVPEPLSNVDKQGNRLKGWAAAYHLAKKAKQDGVDLTKMSHKEYADYSVEHGVEIGSEQLRNAPSKRTATSYAELSAVTGSTTDAEQDSPYFQSLQQQIKDRLDNKLSKGSNPKGEQLSNAINSLADKESNPDKQKHMRKDAAKASTATAFIGSGVEGSSTAKYSAEANKLGMVKKDYTPEDRVFISVNGIRSNRIAPVKDGQLTEAYQGVAAAMAAGATLITDTAAHRNNSNFNVGERELARYLENNGYEEKNGDGIWTKAKKASNSSVEPSSAQTSTNVPGDSKQGSNAKPGTIETDVDTLFDAPEVYENLLTDVQLGEIQAIVDSLSYTDMGKRKVAQIGPDYTYSGVTIKGQDITPAIKSLLKLVEGLTGIAYNGILVNKYPGGTKVGIGWHTDAEPELDMTVPVVSISLGDTAKFKISVWDETRELILNNGSIALFDGSSTHSIMPVEYPNGRVSLTFRLFKTSAQTSTNVPEESKQASNAKSGAVEGTQESVALEYFNELFPEGLVQPNTEYPVGPALDILSEHAKASEQEFYKDLLKNLLSKVPRGLKIIFITEPSKAVFMNDSIGRYEPELSRVVVNLTSSKFKNRKVPEILSHELNHSLTSNFINENPNAPVVQEALAFMEACKGIKIPSLSDRAAGLFQYSFESLKEFLTVNTTNAELASALKNIEVEGFNVAAWLVKTNAAIMQLQAQGVQEDVSRRLPTTQYDSEREGEVRETNGREISQNAETSSEQQAISEHQKDTPSEIGVLKSFVEARNKSNKAAEVEPSADADSLVSDSTTEENDGLLSPSDMDALAQALVDAPEELTAEGMLRAFQPSAEEQELLDQKAKEPKPGEEPTSFPVLVSRVEKLEKSEQTYETQLIRFRNRFKQTGKDNLFVQIRNILGALSQPGGLETILQRPPTEAELKSFKALKELHEQVHFRVKELFRSDILPEYWENEFANALGVTNPNTIKDGKAVNANSPADVESNFSLAITLAIHTWMQRNTTDTFNTLDKLNVLLGYPKGTPQDSEVYTEFGNVAAFTQNFCLQVGQTVTSYLGISVRKSANITAEQELQASLGVHVMAIMDNMGLITTKNVTDLRANKVKNRLGSLENESESTNPEYDDPEAVKGVSKVKTKAVVGLVGSALQENGGDNFINAYWQTLSKTPLLLGDIFEGSIAADMPSLKPNKTVTRSIKGLSQEVGDEHAGLLKKVQSHAVRIREEIFSPMQKLYEQSEETFWKCLNFIAQPVHPKYAKAEDARVENLKNSWIHAFEFLTTLTTEEGKIPPLYLSTFTSANNRYYYRSQLFNPQSSKVHESLSTMQDVPVEIPLNDSKDPNYKYWTVAVGARIEGLGFGTHANRKIAPDKSSLEVFVEAFEKTMEQPANQRAVEAAMKLLKGSTLEEEDIGSIADFVQRAGLDVQSFTGLLEYARFIQARRNPAVKTHSTTLKYDSDGINNGACSTYMAHGVAAEELLKGVGIIPLSEEGTKQLNTVHEVQEAGVADIYTALKQAVDTVDAKDISKALEAREGKPPSHTLSFGDNTVDTFNYMDELLRVLYPSMGSRDSSKAWTIPFMYSAGFRALKRALSTDMVNGIYANIHKYGSILDQPQEAVAPEVRQAAQENYGAIINALNSVFKLTGTPLIYKGKDAHRFEPLAEFTLTTKELLALRQAHAETHGLIFELATKKVHGQYLGIKKTVNDVFSNGSDLFSILYEDLKAKIVERGEMFTVGHHKQILKQLSQYSPSMNSPLSMLNKEQEGTMLFQADFEPSVVKDAKTQQFSSYRLTAEQRLKAPKSNPKTLNAAFLFTAPRITSLGAGSIALYIQGLDARVTTEVTAALKATNNHDSNGIVITQAEKLGKMQNEVYFNALLDYHVGLESLETILRPLEGLAANWGNLSEEAQEALESVLSGYPDKGFINFETIVDDLVSMDLSKLGILTQTHAIHQYGTQDGQYVLTNEDRDAIAKAKERVEVRKQELQARLDAAMEVLSQDQKEYVASKEEANKAESTPAPEPTSTPTPTPVAKPTQQAKPEPKPKPTPTSELAPKSKTLNAIFSLKPGTETDSNTLIDMLPEGSLAGGLFSKLADIFKGLDTIEVVLVSQHDLPAELPESFKDVDAAGMFHNGKIYLKIDINYVSSFTETLLHELVHAHTVAAIKEPTEAGKEAIKRLNVLMEATTVKLSEAGLPNPYGTSLTEFLAYALTRKGITEQLAQIQTESGERTLAALKKVLKHVYDTIASIFGRKLTESQIDGVSAVLYDTLVLVSSNYNSQLSLDTHLMTLSSQDVFESLDSGSISPEFNRHLNSLASTISQRFGITDSNIQAKLDEAVAGQYSGAIPAGFNLSEKEANASMAVELVVDYMMNQASQHAVSNRFRKLYTQARESMKPQDFYAGNWATASQSVRDMAIRQWEYLFKPSGTNGANLSVPRFVALAVTSEEFQSMLTDSLNQEARQNVTWFDRLMGLLNTVLQWIENSRVGVKSQLPMNTQLELLMGRMLDLEVQRKQGILARVDNAIDQLSEKSGKVGEVVGKVWESFFDKVATYRSSSNSVVRTAATAATVVHAKEFAQLPDVALQVRNNLNPGTELGAIAAIANEITAPTTLKRITERFVRMANTAAKVRRRETIQSKIAVNMAFTDEGANLTKDDHTAITYGLLRSNLQSLMSSYSAADILQMVVTPRKRAQVIAQLERQVLAMPEGNDKMIRAKLLGWYSATGETKAGLVKNGLAIHNGIETHYQSETLDLNTQNPSVIALNQLAALYALQYNEQHLDTLSTLYKTEANGLAAVLTMHHTVATASEQAFQGNPLDYTNGYMPEITNPHREIQAISADVDTEAYERLGWQRIGINRRDANDTSKERVLMFMPNSSRQSYISGAVDMKDTDSKGFELLDRTHPGLGKMYKARLAEGKKRAALDARNFNPRTAAHAAVLHTDTQGVVISYHYEMDAVTRDRLLERNNNFGDLLGAIRGTLAYMPEIKNVNAEVIDFLHKTFKDNYKSRPQDFVELSPNSTDPKAVLRWRMLPWQFREELINRFGIGNKIYIPTLAMTPLFGFSAYSLAEAFDKEAGTRNFMEKLLVTTTKAMWGDTAQMQVGKYHGMWVEGVGTLKNVIVIRNMKVFFNNIAANTLYLAIRISKPGMILKTSRDAILYGKEYVKDVNELSLLSAKIAAGANPADLEARLADLKDRIARNPLKDFIEAGMLSTIVEDLSTLQSDYTYQSEIQKKLEKFSNKIPSGLKTGFSYAMMSPNTPLFKVMAEAAQLSDFMAKYTLYVHNREQGMSHEEALSESSEVFINYDVPTSRELQALNDSGLLMFTKYRLRIQQIMLRLFRENGFKALGLSWLAHQYAGFPGIFNPALTHMDHNPLSAGLFSLPGAITEITPLQIVTPL